MATLLSDHDDAAISDPPDDDGDGGEPVRWIVVATFWSPAQMHLARLRLESENIDCQIANENIVAVDFLLCARLSAESKFLFPNLKLKEPARFWRNRRNHLPRQIPTRLRVVLIVARPTSTARFCRRKLSGLSLCP